MVGQRWDLDVDHSIDIEQPDWEQRLISQATAAGKQMTPDGIDYLLFSKGLYQEVPRFAVGRAGWDNWMVYHAHVIGVPIVNASVFITAVHQNHDYSHHPDGDRGSGKARKPCGTWSWQVGDTPYSPLRMRTSGSIRAVASSANLSSDDI